MRMGFGKHGLKLMIGVLPIQLGARQISRRPSSTVVSELTWPQALKSVINQEKDTNKSGGV